MVSRLTTLGLGSVTMQFWGIPQEKVDMPGTCIVKDSVPIYLYEHIVQVFQQSLKVGFETTFCHQLEIKVQGSGKYGSLCA